MTVAYLDVDVFLGRSLKELEAQLIGQLLASLIRDDTLILHIALVAHQDNLSVIPRIGLDLSTPVTDPIGTFLYGTGKESKRNVYQSWTLLKDSSLVMSYIKRNPMAPR